MAVIAVTFLTVFWEKCSFLKINSYPARVTFVAQTQMNDSDPNGQFSIV